LEVLRDPVGCTLFRAFLKTVVASEVLDFWIEIELFRSLDVNDRERTAKAMFVFQKYCSPSSDHAINIPERMRSTLKNYVDNQRFDRLMFDETQEYVYGMLCLDCFLRFKQSEMYNNYKGNSGHILKKNSVTVLAALDRVRSRRERKSTCSQENLMLYTKHMKQMHKNEKKLLKTSTLRRVASSRFYICNAGMSK